MCRVNAGIHVDLIRTKCIGTSCVASLISHIFSCMFGTVQVCTKRWVMRKRRGPRTVISNMLCSSAAVYRSDFTVDKMCSDLICGLQ